MLCCSQKIWLLGGGSHPSCGLCSQVPPLKRCHCHTEPWGSSNPAKRPAGVTELWNVLGWKVPTRTKSKTCTEQLQNPSMCLRVLSKLILKCGRCCGQPQDACSAHPQWEELLPNTSYNPPDATSHRSLCGQQLHAVPSVVSRGEADPAHETTARVSPPCFLLCLLQAITDLYSIVVFK